MHLDTWTALLPQEPFGRAVALGVLLVLLMTLATAVVGVAGEAPIWDITVDPASGLLPF